MEGTLLPSFLTLMLHGSNRMSQACYLDMQMTCKHYGQLVSCPCHAISTNLNKIFKPSFLKLHQVRLDLQNRTFGDNLSWFFRQTTFPSPNRQQ